MRTIGPRHDTSLQAFSLVEVVIALGVATFALIGIMGLFIIGLRTSHASEGEIQAANVASLILSSVRAAPLSATNTTTSPVPALNLTNGFASAYNGKYVGWDGMLTNSPNNAAFAISCSTGTNAFTGNGVAQVYLILSWPPQAGTNSPSYYEIATYIPFS